MSAGKIWLLVAGLAIAAAAAVAIERDRVKALQGEIEAGRQKRRVASGLAAENRRLREKQASAGEIALLAKAPEELPRLREDAARLQAKLREPERAAANAASSGEAVVLPAHEWKNVGRATPRATVETALWAAAGGDVEALMETLLLDPAARVRAEQLLASLPEASRALYRTPERLIALLAAKDVPTGATTAQVSTVGEDGENETSLRVRLEDAAGASHAARLTLRRGSDGWRLLVSGRAVEKYAATLKSGAAADTR